MNTNVIQATLYRLEIPLLRSFQTATGFVTSRTIGLVSLSRNNVTGWGEAAPYPGQDESFVDVLNAAKAGATTPTLAAAMDEAMCDLLARESGISLADEVGLTDPSVPISVAVGMGEAAMPTVTTATKRGVDRFKIKIMPGHTDHVADIRHAFPEVTLGVDANGSFSASTISEILALGGLDIAYVEQPTPEPNDEAINVLADRGFTVFADESVRSGAMADRALALEPIAGVVIKPGRLGWRASIDVVQMARAAGKLWRASGLFESSVGRSFSLALASASDAFMSDVAPASWFFAHDVGTATAIDGSLVAPTGSGTGLDVNIEVVHDLAMEAIALSGSAIPNLD